MDMILNDKELRDRALWESKGFILPGFDRGAIRERAYRQPVWIHFGAGNIFRAFPAMLQQRLLDAGLQDRGIIVAEGYDYEIIDAAYTPYDNLSVAVTLKAGGGIEKTVVASVVESLKMDAASFPRLKEIFAAASLQMLSLTITEKGYSLTGGGGTLLPAVEADFGAGPAAPESYMGKLTSLCYHRYRQGVLPLALVSMDNCSHNGALLYEAVRRFASAWVENGLVESGFLAYVENPSRLSFPWSMIDKITPRPDGGVAGLLKETGLEGTEGTVTSKNTYVAPFVNAEESQYLVIEDAFPNGRPPLEKAGVIITDRETVDKTEKMKVSACLNPLHTGLAVFGCLLFYERISDTMKDESLSALARRIADEGLPVVADPGIMSPAEFADTVIRVRLPNPFMPDTPQRIATDTSQKIRVRFGETIKAYLSAGKDPDTLRAIPLVLAGWCRYLLGVDDRGEAFELSPDPLLEKLRGQLGDIRLGQDGGAINGAKHDGRAENSAGPDSGAIKSAGPVSRAVNSAVQNSRAENSAGQNSRVADSLAPLLADDLIFGVNLYEAGLADRVTGYFVRMIAGPGAVRKVLEEVLYEAH